MKRHLIKKTKKGKRERENNMEIRRHKNTRGCFLKYFCIALPCSLTTQVQDVSQQVHCIFIYKTEFNLH